MTLKQKRLLSIAIDYFVCLYIVVPITWILNINYIYQFFLVIIVFSFKDLVFKNKSIGKRKFGLEILDNNNNIPSKLALYLRNFTAVIWFVEIFLILLFNKRIGDFIFKTKVVSCDTKII